MIEFLLKSTITMTVLLGMYYLLFEREKIHQFNRFYLLSALVFSFAVPFITVITYIEKIKVSTEPITPSLSNVNNASLEHSVDYVFYVGWILYALITSALMVRFIKNIFVFIKKAANNPTVQIGKAKLVLLDEKVFPHTFHNYIFVNKDEYETNRIEEELYTHEYTHVIQKHTLDILFIEALKTIFWFNPMLYFYKKAIQLNHEFLADQKVIATTVNTIYYQNLLLKKVNVGTTFSMASNLNFSLTKKRLLMMTKTTSTTKAGFLKLAIAPILAGLMMLLCTETIAQKTPETASFNTFTSKSYAIEKVNKDAPKRTKNSSLEANNKTFSLSPVSLNDGKTKSIETKALTQQEIETLKSLDPEMYNDNTIKDYVSVKITYTNDKGELVTQVMYKKEPKK